MVLKFYRLLFKSFSYFLILVMSILFSAFSFATTKIVQNNDIQLWSESFGNPKNPPVLLISGAGAQCILWPDAFCKMLAKQGFFVIRYDNRDVGFSSKVDYSKNPYSITDLTQDAIAVLNTYHLEKAHIVGFSMGGEIAQFLGAYHPEHVLSLTLVATSTDMEPGFLAFKGIHDPKRLSGPAAEYVKWANRPVNPKEQSLKEKINDFLYSFRLLNGTETPFDEKLYRQIAKLNFKRGQDNNPYLNHANAMNASFSEHRKAIHRIHSPTLILHGTADPIFGKDHADALNKGISNSKLVMIQGMGHTLSPKFYDEIVPLIKAHAAEIN